MRGARRNRASWRRAGPGEGAGAEAGVSEASATQRLDELLAIRQSLLGFVRKRIDDPELAEDVLQSALLKAVEKAPGLRDEDKLVPWFYAILRNAITDTYRRRAARPPALELEAAEKVEMEEDAVQDLCRCMAPLVGSLKPEYREVIESLDLAGDATESLAARLNVTTANLKVRRHRARQALRQRLTETCGACAEHHCLDCSCGRSGKL